MTIIKRSIRFVLVFVSIIIMLLILTPIYMLVSIALWPGLLAYKLYVLVDGDEDVALIPAVCFELLYIIIIVLLVKLL